MGDGLMKESHSVLPSLHTVHSIVPGCLGNWLIQHIGKHFKYHTYFAMSPLDLWTNTKSLATKLNV